MATARTAATTQAVDKTPVKTFLTNLLKILWGILAPLSNTFEFFKGGIYKTPLAKTLPVTTGLSRIFGLLPTIFYILGFIGTLAVPLPGITPLYVASSLAILKACAITIAATMVGRAVGAMIGSLIDILRINKVFEKAGAETGTKWGFRKKVLLFMESTIGIGLFGEQVTIVTIAANKAFSKKTPPETGVKFPKEVASPPSPRHTAGSVSVMEELSEFMAAQAAPPAATENKPDKDPRDPDDGNNNDDGNGFGNSNNSITRELRQSSSSSRAMQSPASDTPSMGSSPSSSSRNEGSTGKKTSTPPKGGHTYGHFDTGNGEGAPKQTPDTKPHSVLPGKKRY